jgi:DNA (cytosine-5)-methyltransferase 1
MAHIPPNMNYLFVDGTDWKVKGTMSNIYRRSHPLRPGYTVMAYGGGGTWSYHYEKSRGMLTNRERARLQTFPDDYMFEGKRSQVRTQIGEAVPVRLGTKLAEIAISVLESVKN